ncbi:MAG: histidine kinase dimerization/phospho-acceptor domain-containing protein [Myxococcota bacterium]
MSASRFPLSEAPESAAWTLPPPPPPVPSRPAVLRGLARTSTLAVGGSGALAFATALIVLPLRAAEVPGLLRFVGLLVLAVVTVALLASAHALTPAAPLPAALNARQHPPSAAVAAAFRTPGRVLSASFAVLVVMSLLEASGLVAFSGLPGRVRVATALLAFGILQAGLFFAAVGWRSTVWGWLASLNPGDVDLPMRPALAARLVRRVLSALGLVVACLGAPFLAHVETAGPWALGLAGAVALGALLAGALFAWRLGRDAVADVRVLTDRVRSFSLDLGQSGRLRLGSLEARARTSAAEPLARRVRRLSRTYAHRAQVEADARERIEAAQRLKTRFMAFMSHDLRSPLSSINGFAEILASEMDGPLTPEQRESVASIQQSGDELHRLVTEIVDTARLEAGRMELLREPCDPWRLLLDAVLEARDRAREELPIEVLPGASLPLVVVDSERTQQALLGVLAHVHRMAPASTIRVRAHGEGRGVCWDVEAPGLPPEPERQIFEAFRELRRASGRRVGGLGLGLALARALMQAQGGDVAYTSQGPGGPRFRFTLPVNAPS